MAEFFKALNTDFFTGLTIFFTLITLIIGVYKNINNETVREKHKDYLLQKLKFIANLPIKKLGYFASTTFTVACEHVFKRPKRYELRDPILWNWRIVLLFLLLGILVNAISLYKIVISTEQFIFVFLPLLVILSSFLFQIAVRYNHPKSVLKTLKKPRYLRRQEKKVKVKGKHNRFFKVGKNINLIEFDIITIFIAVTPKVVLFYIIYFVTFIFAREKSHELLASTILLFQYGLYIFANVLSFNVTRILVHKLTYSEQVLKTLKLVFIDLMAATVIMAISFYIADQIVYVLPILLSSERYVGSISEAPFNQLALDYHFWYIFISSFLPSIVFLLFAFIEIFSRIFILPIQKAISYLFENIIKYNYHWYVFAAIIALVFIKVINFAMN